MLKLFADCGIHVKFPSHDLTGGDSSKMLDLLFAGKAEYKGYGHEVLKIMKNVKQFAECRAYSDVEIDEFEILTEELHMMVKAKFPEFKTSQKIHLLIFHVIPFMRLHFSWGKYGEQGIERSHQKFMRHTSRMKNGDKLLYAQKQSILETAFFDKQAKC